MAETQMKYFGTEKEAQDFYDELEASTFKMRSPFIPNNPEGKQWGVQWS